MHPGQPSRSYVIWFSQRTGSTLLTAALTGTGVAGRPTEALNDHDPETLTLAELHLIWQNNTTPNGVFGLKYGPQRDGLAAWTQCFRRVLNLPDQLSAADVWAETFPSCRHLFVTRRNKVRLAVSWWRAIQSGEWHRPQGQGPSRSVLDQRADLEDKYSFEALHHLFVEASLREALIEEFFADAGLHPMTVVYEDFIRDYEGTVRSVLGFLGLDVPKIILPQALERLADDVSEAWVQRFRLEQQADWTTPAW